MKCFECSMIGQAVDAIGICHHCSVGLCSEHGVLADDPILVHEPIARVVALPKKARELLCQTCLEALRQRHVIEEQSAMPGPSVAHR